MHSIRLLQIIMVVITSLLAKTATADESVSLPNCPEKCGSVTIPFPFGTTEDCSLDNTFLINCNQTSSTITPTPFLPQTNQTILNTSLNGKLRVTWPIASDCYTEKGKRVNQTSGYINMTHFHVSPIRNKLIGVGCDTVGAITAFDIEEKNYTTGCVALCNRLDDIPSNGSCSGTGCCEISIPQGHHRFVEVGYASGAIFSNHSAVHDFNPCGYAFLVEDGGYMM